MIKKWYSRWLWSFDRVFGDNRKVGWQLLYIVVALTVTVAFVALVGWLLLLAGLVHEHPSDLFSHAVGVVFNFSTFAPQTGDVQFPALWQLVGALLGTVLFSGLTITFVVNFFNNRLAAYRNGTVRYWFGDHVLFLGGGEMAVPMLKQVFQDADLRGRHIVVLTNRDVPQVRQSIIGQLGDAERKMKITFLRGRRDDVDELCSVGVQRAGRLYIVGDDPSADDYDSVSIACWRMARRLCTDRKAVPCYLLLEHASSMHVFLHNSEAMPSCFDTTVVNRLEAVAQRVLVHNGDDNPAYPALDRDGIGPDCGRTVHLVLYGMTPFACSMATTAAHLCHFPNFVTRNAQGEYGENLDRRTRITFIAPDIECQRHFLTSRLASLFALSRVTVDGVATVPDEDFLDVEWEFVDGSIADPRVRARLEDYYQANREGRTYLTLALCENEARRNIASALYLPEAYHHIELRADGRTVDFERTIPVYVFQPDSAELLNMANSEVPLYRNIFPIGSLRESYDPSIRRHIREGKRINYIYSQGAQYGGMPDEAEIDAKWTMNYARQVSNIYGSNQIGVKLRSIGLGGEALRAGARMPEEAADLMAVVEHNRWNMEKLLVGYSPVEKSQREELKRLEPQGGEKFEAKKDALKRLRETRFQHYCIAPFCQLTDDVRLYDRIIVQNITDVLAG